MMTVNTTIRPSSKLRIEIAEPGEGYRLLGAYEVILSTDDVWHRGLGWRKNWEHIGHPLLSHWRPRRRKLPSTQELYDELLFAVASKHLNETRHQTALRYINEAEARTRTTSAIDLLVGVAKLSKTVYGY